MADGAAPPRPPQPPIPLAVIGGYLGAGKTTLLNRLLTHAGGRRIAVLVNDFGDINIDASLIRARTDDVIQLENGCICCTIGGQLVETLRALGQRPERPDWLVIEASGVSDPSRIAQIGLLGGAFRLHGIIVAVDAERLDATLSDRYVGDVVRRQIAGATAVVLTKIDRVSATQRAAARQIVAALAPAAPIVETARGNLPPGLIFDADVIPRRAESISDLAQTQAHAGIGSFSVRTPYAFDKQKLRDVFRIPNVGLLRAKGIVRLVDQPQPYELHVIGQRILLTPFASAAEPGSALVVIGRFTDTDEAALRERIVQATHQA